jgi:hypothetical protein
MKLTDDQLRTLYFGTVKPFQHPDPVGFMTRALLLSEGDPDFVEDNNIGFMPLDPDHVFERTGVTDVFSLQENVIAALTLDRLNFEQGRSVEDMVLATHFPEVVSDQRTKAQQEFLDAIAENRKDVHDILEPPLATLKDFIRLLKQSSETANVSKEEQDFFEFLLDQ